MPNDIKKIADSTATFDDSFILLKQIGKKSKDNSAQTIDDSKQNITTKDSLDRNILSILTSISQAETNTTVSKNKSQTVYSFNKVTTKDSFGVNPALQNDSHKKNSTTEILANLNSTVQSDKKINALSTKLQTAYSINKDKKQNFSTAMPDLNDNTKNNSPLSVADTKDSANNNFSFGINDTKDSTNNNFSFGINDTKTSANNLFSQGIKNTKDNTNDKFSLGIKDTKDNAGEIGQSSGINFKETIDSSSSTIKKLIEEARNYKSPGGKELTTQEKQQVDKLKKMDKEVRSHENAHKTAGGSLVLGVASYSYTTGPDGSQYAIGGEVKIDVSANPNNPEETIMKMQRVITAALAPADPSPQDRSVASRAAEIESQAKDELNRQKSEMVQRPLTNGSMTQSALDAYKKASIVDEIIGQVIDRVDTNLIPETLKRFFTLRSEDQSEE